MAGSPPGSPDALLRVVPSLVDGMGPGFPEEEQVQNLLQIAQIVDSSFGSRSAQLCAVIVNAGGIAHLAVLCGHPREWLHQTAMLVLGNLAADSVEVQSAFQDAGGFENLVPHLFSDNPSTVMFALGAIRNTCSDPDCVGIMQKQGAMRRLQDLARSEDPVIAEYAMGCLHNATEIIAATVAQRQQVLMRRRDAVIHIQARVRGWLTRHRPKTVAAPMPPPQAPAPPRAPEPEAVAAAQPIEAVEEGAGVGLPPARYDAAPVLESSLPSVAEEEETAEAPAPAVAASSAGAGASVEERADTPEFGSMKPPAEEDDEEEYQDEFEEEDEPAVEFTAAPEAADAPPAPTAAAPTAAATDEFDEFEQPPAPETPAPAEAPAEVAAPTPAPAPAEAVAAPVEASEQSIPEPPAANLPPAPAVEAEVASTVEATPPPPEPAVDEATTHTKAAVAAKAEAAQAATPEAAAAQAATTEADATQAATPEAATEQPAIEADVMAPPAAEPVSEPAPAAAVDAPVAAEQAAHVTAVVPPPAVADGALTEAEARAAEAEARAAAAEARAAAAEERARLAEMKSVEVAEEAAAKAAAMLTAKDVLEELIRHVEREHAPSLPLPPPPPPLNNELTT